MVLRSLIAGWILLPLGIGGAAAAQVSPVLVWEAGSIDGPPETIWGRIADALIMDSAVVALDIVASEARMFDLGGGFLRYVGGEGQGPGEFARPVSVTEVGDSAFVVSDFAQSRLSTFDAGGDLLHTERIELPRGGYLQEGWVLRHGWWGGFMGLVGRGPDEQGRDLSEDSLRLVRWKPGAQIDTLTSIPGNPVKVRLTIAAHRWHPSGSTGPGGGFAAVGDSLVVALDGTGGRVIHYRVGVDAWSIVARRDLPERGRLLSEPERDELERVWRDAQTDELLDLADEVRIPAGRSPWTGLRVDGEVLWLRRAGFSELAEGYGEEWVALRPNGLLGTAFELPPSVRLLDMRDGRIAAVRKDHFGVEHLQMYALDGSR